MLQYQTRRRKISIPQQLLAPRDERCHRLTLLWTQGTAKLGRLRFSGGCAAGLRASAGANAETFWVGGVASATGKVAGGGGAGTAARKGGAAARAVAAGCVAAGPVGS